MKPTYVKPVLETITFEDKESISMIVNDIKTYVSENVFDSCFSDFWQEQISLGLFDPSTFTQGELDALQPGTFQAS